jgi:acetyltransferase-like isoleucine patch superfamily enzyme
MLNEINILGYAGSFLAMLLEELYVRNFNGTVRIIMNDEKKRSEAPFETNNINYLICNYNEVHPIPKNGFIFCSNKPTTKEFLYSFYKKCWNINMKDFFSIIHPSSVIASTVKFNEALYIMPLSSIAAYTKVGFGVTIARNCSIGPHVILKDFCSIHPATNIAGNVSIGRVTTIGPGTTILNDVKVGNNTIIGGGSVITQDIPNNVLAYGNPCRVIKQI